MTETLAIDDELVVNDVSEPLDANKTKRMPLSKMHAPVFLTSPLTSTDFDGDAFSTTAKTLIDLSDKFSLPAGVSAVLAYLYASDSGSGGGVAWAGLGPSANPSYALFNHLQGAPNGAPRVVTGVVPCDANGDIYFECVATGVGTLNVVLFIWGYWL